MLTIQRTQISFECLILGTLKVQEFPRTGLVPTPFAVGRADTNRACCRSIRVKSDEDCPPTMKHTEQALSHRGPSLLALAVAYTLLVAASIICGLLLKHGVAVVNPYSSAEGSQRFFADNPNAIRVAAFFSFGSSVPLGIYAATVVSRLRFLGVRAAGTHIALFGGFAASIALVISAFSAWVLSVPEVATSLVATRVLHFMTLLFGGVSFAVGFGLMATGVSVTGYFFRLLPR
jgi:hypothetical protein